MKTNVGKLDKAIRIIAGVAFVAVAAILGGTWWVFGAVGVVLFVTALTGFCGLYTLIGVNTCKVTRGNS
ncbi:MAG: YgaP family membrane protein [Spirochaetota bacterium]